MSHAPQFKTSLHMSDWSRCHINGLGAVSHALQFKDTKKRLQCTASQNTQQARASIHLQFTIQGGSSSLHIISNVTATKTASFHSKRRSQGKNVTALIATRSRNSGHITGYTPIHVPVHESEETKYEQKRTLFHLATHSSKEGTVGT